MLQLNKRGAFWLPHKSLFAFPFGLLKTDSHLKKKEILLILCKQLFICLCFFSYSSPFRVTLWFAFVSV